MTGGGNVVCAVLKLPSACPAGPAGGSWAAVNACCLPRSSLAGSCPAPVSAAPLRSCRRPADSAASRSPPLRLPIAKHLQVYTQIIMVIMCNCTERCQTFPMLPLQISFLIKWKWKQDTCVSPIISPLVNVHVTHFNEVYVNIAGL